MTKKTSALVRILIALAVLAIFALAVNTYADTRDSRDRDTGRGAESPIPPPPAPSPTPPPPPSSGGITSLTSGNVDTGGNEGGVVVTGDEHVEVFEINIGPTNPPLEDPELVEGPPPPSPAPQCDRRSSDCPADNTERAR